MDDMYESEFTKFINKFLKENPREVELQKEGRAMWWDKKLNKDEQEHFIDSKVPQKGYVYYGDK